VVDYLADLWRVRLCWRDNGLSYPLGRKRAQIIALLGRILVRIAQNDAVVVARPYRLYRTTNAHQRVATSVAPVRRSPTLSRNTPVANPFHQPSLQKDERDNCRDRKQRHARKNGPYLTAAQCRLLVEES
jgi:hypothetical protein